MSRETAQFLLGQLPDGFCDETVPLGDAVLVDQGRADLLDPLLVVPELAFVLHQQRCRELPQGGRTTGPDERSDQEGLIDMTHPHPIAGEVDDLLRGVHSMNLRLLCRPVIRSRDKRGMIVRT